MHTPTMIPVMDRWSMWYRPSEKTGRQRAARYRRQTINDASSDPSPTGTCCIWTGVSGVLATVAVSTLGRQFHHLRERAVADLVGGGDFHHVDAPGLQLFQESHRVGPCGREQDKNSVVTAARGQQDEPLLLIRVVSHYNHSPSLCIICHRPASQAF